MAIPMDLYTESNSSMAGFCCRSREELSSHVRKYRPAHISGFLCRVLRRHAHTARWPARLSVGFLVREASTGISTSVEVGHINRLFLCPSCLHFRSGIFGSFRVSGWPVDRSARATGYVVGIDRVRALAVILDADDHASEYAAEFLQQGRV